MRKMHSIFLPGWRVCGSGRDSLTPRKRCAGREPRVSELPRWTRQVSIAPQPAGHAGPPHPESWGCVLSKRLRPGPVPQRSQCHGASGLPRSGVREVTKEPGCGAAWESVPALKSTITIAWPRDCVPVATQRHSPGLPPGQSFRTESSALAEENLRSNGVAS